MLPLLLLPALDLISIWVASASALSLDSADSIARSIWDLLASLLYWVALFVFARLWSLRVDRLQPGLMRASAAALLVLAILTVVYYHLLLWSFIAANGHAPSAENLVFLADNVSRVPQHVLQTAPLMVLGSLAVALLAAAVIHRALSRLPERATPRPAVAFAQGLVLLSSWYVIGGAGAYRAPSYVLLDRDPQLVTDARVSLAFDALPARQASTPATPTPDGPRRPVIVILVESLRFDLLETNPEAIPFFRRMYDEHLGLTRAYATASHSNLSDLAFWYSQYPLRGRGRENFPQDAEWRGVSLFELFKEHSYRTAYISSQNEGWGRMINWLDTPAIDFFFHSEDFRGETWENYDDTAGLGGLIKKGILQAGKIEDSQTLEIAKQWITSVPSGDAFFLGMNLQNTHFSYVTSPRAAQPYQPSDLGFRAVYYRWPAEHRGNVRNRYLNSVHDVDRLLGEFVEFLKQQGIWEECLFVVVGDNGEAFYEHGFGNHSGPMYEEVVRTLAFIKLPGSAGVERPELNRPVSHIDIAATIADVAQLPRPWSFQGRSILSADCRDRPVFMYANALVRQYGIISGPWKYLLTEFPTASEELYHLGDDPTESTNLLESGHRAQSDQLATSLRHWTGLQRRYYSEQGYLSKYPPDFCSTDN